MVRLLAFSAARSCGSNRDACSDVQTKILLKSLNANKGFILEDLDGDFLFITKDEATVCASFVSSRIRCSIRRPSQVAWIRDEIEKHHKSIYFNPLDLQKKA